MALKYGGLSEEVSIVTDELLAALVEAQAPEHIKAFGKEAGATHDDVQLLRLDFQNILRIDNLWSFVNLRRLDLGNNCIESVDNLAVLVNLEWLDLSYNHIEEIQGLETLTKLRDLSLHHNHIRQIAGLDTLTALDCLSIGENELETIEDAPILYLRRFKALRSLNLKGNKLCEDPRYQSYCCAFLPTLQYLDYARISNTAREAAIIQYQDSLEITLQDEGDINAAAQKEADGVAEDERYVTACVAGLNRSSRVEKSMDADVLRLSPIPGVGECIEAFKTFWQRRYAQIAAWALEKCAERQAEAAEFRDAIRDALAESGQTASKTAHEFLEAKREAADKASRRRGAMRAGIVQDITEHLEQTQKTLMAIELGLVGQLEDAIHSFERVYTEFVNTFVENVQAIMTEVREEEEKFHKNITDLSVAFLAAFSKGEVDGPLELTDDVLNILRDKTSLTNAINGAHDAHLLAIDSQEDDIVAAGSAELEALVSSLVGDEETRHRERIAEIRKFFAFQKEDINYLDADDT